MVVVIALLLINTLSNIRRYLLAAFMAKLSHQTLLNVGYIYTESVACCVLCLCSFSLCAGECITCQNKEWRSTHRKYPPEGNKVKESAKLVGHEE